MRRCLFLTLCHLRHTSTSRLVISLASGTSWTAIGVSAAVGQCMSGVLCRLSALTAPCLCWTSLDLWSQVLPCHRANNSTKWHNSNVGDWIEAEFSKLLLDYKPPSTTLPEAELPRGLTLMQCDVKSTPPSPRPPSVRIPSSQWSYPVLAPPPPPGPPSVRIPSLLEGFRCDKDYG